MELRGIYPADILPVVFVYGVLVAASEAAAEEIRLNAEEGNRQNNHKKSYGEGTAPGQFSGSNLLNDERRKSTVGEADAQQNNKRNDESSRCYRGRFPIGVVHPAVGSVCDELSSESTGGETDERVEAHTLGLCGGGHLETPAGTVPKYRPAGVPYTKTVY